MLRCYLYWTKLLTWLVSAAVVVWSTTRRQFVVKTVLWQWRFTGVSRVLSCSHRQCNDARDQRHLGRLLPRPLPLSAPFCITFLSADNRRVRSHHPHSSASVLSQYVFNVSTRVSMCFLIFIISSFPEAKINVLKPHLFLLYRIEFWLSS